jgi:hypothetical protein
MSESAAGRPVIDAEQAQPVAEAAADAGGQRQGAFRSRFAAVYLVLAVVAGAAIGSFVVLMARPDAPQAPRWSSFQPDGSAAARLHQIVEKIPPKYRRVDGSQLVSVSVTDPQAQVTGSDGQSLITVPVNRIAYERGGDFPEVDTNGALQFTLCGHGPDCSIDTGKASVERYELVQRQALELALYTFKYVDGIEKVTVLLPPSFDSKSLDASGSPEVHRTAVFLQRQDVQQELSRPLTATLGQAAPKIGKVDQRDLGSIQRLTIPHTYSYALTQAQDGAVVLVLKSAVTG